MSGFSSRGGGNSTGGIGADIVRYRMKMVAWDSERRPTGLEIEVAATE